MLGMQRFGVAIVLAWSLLPLRCFADTWTEVGNAGQLVTTGQVTTGNPFNSLDTIIGSFSGANDIDLFLIYVSDPVAFSASASSLQNSQLFLFTNTGLGVITNDDRTLIDNNALIPDASGRPGLGPTTTGNYWLGISEFNHSPLSTGNKEIFAPGSGVGLRGPTGPGGANPLTAWANISATGAAGGYTITLTGAKFATPEPTALVLYGIGALIAFRAFQRRKAARGFLKNLH